MRDRERRFLFPPPVDQVEIEQGEVAAGSTGAAVWKAGSLLADFMATDGTSTIRGQRVLELGCGTGLCGIVAARLGASGVVLTDASDAVLQRAMGNVARNLEPPLRGRVRVQQLLWGGLDDPELSGQFDCVIASDVLYLTASWRPLAQTVASLLKPKKRDSDGGVLLLAEAGHDYLPAASAIGGFRIVAEGCGLTFDPEVIDLGNDAVLQMARVLR